MTRRDLFGGWQLNTIVRYNSGTPFTVSDSANFGHLSVAGGRQGWMQFALKLIL